MLSPPNAILMLFARINKGSLIKVYNKAKRKFENIVERDRTGECPIYLGKFWQCERRESEKAEKSNRWYEKGGYQTVMFIDATPSVELAAECKKALKNTELKI